MTREEIISKHRLSAEFERRGIKLIHAGPEKFKCKCPFHEDGTPSCEINDAKGLWNCFGCKSGGSIIDAVMRFDNTTAAEAMRKLDGGIVLSHAKPDPKPAGRVVATYQYHYEDGSNAYQVCRLEPKSFRQRHDDGKGGWIWSMEGVLRVLYRATEIAKSKQVWIVEGEKDADNLAALGFCATCNVGGAGKWLDAYTGQLDGKDVVLCGDNDAPGHAHIKLVFDSISGKVNSTRTVKVPQPHKDISDFLATFPADEHQAKRSAVDALWQAAPELHRGIDLQVYSITDMERDYIEYIRTIDGQTLSLNRWLPSLGVRGLVPGELATFIADTGVGKTAVLQNLAYHAAPLPTLMFEMELPTSLLYERFVAMGGSMSQKDVEKAYRTTLQPMAGSDNFMRHYFVCPRSGITMDEIRKTIANAELKMGERPRLILIDYVQLIQGRGNSRYERTSNIAEDLKTLAKETKTIIVIASQVGRKKEEDKKGGVGLHDAKDSGAIENSSGMVIGMWKEDKKTLKMRVLKNTKGTGGIEITCNFDGETMTITERSPIQQGD
jgi:5S rRNA maturation endonuclease (ribonuclease M5)